MSMRMKTTYKVRCDYPDCHMDYGFWESTEEHATKTAIDDDEWLCLFTGDNEPRFFCSLHLRYRPVPPAGSPTVFFDSGSPDKQTSLHALNKYYEAVSTPQPLPKPECEATILATLTSEDTK